MTHIIPEEELDINDDYYQQKSPFMGGILDGNKISAIGCAFDIMDGRKDSPFWDSEQIHEF